jgi:hypothetical protein
MARRQVLGDPVRVGVVHLLGGAQTAAALGVLGGQQMPFARAGAHDLATGRDFEPFGHCFSRSGAFGTSHNINFFAKEREL